jgi:hypothetical protein
MFRSRLSSPRAHLLAFLLCLAGQWLLATPLLAQPAAVHGRTPIGPFVLSLGFVDNGSRLLQFTQGRPVAEGSLLDDIH